MDQTDSALWLDMSLDDVAKLRKQKAGGGSGKAQKAAPAESKPKQSVPSTKQETHPSLLNKVCSNCLKPGHLKKDCTSPRVCLICGSAEHLKADCPKAGQGQTCLVCGSTNHLKKVCPHINKTCDNCNKVGHLKSVCKQLPVAARLAVSAAVGKPVPPVNEAASVKSCPVCGSVAHDKKNCPHKFQICESCGKQGHFTALCPSKTKA